jgi:XTP/dITP diphosphohydrolase
MPDRKLLIATNNAHKVRELVDLLDGLPWNVVSLDEFPEASIPVEDGDTFEANALKKATHYCRHYGVWCVADDSGLVVDALDGAPGVLSARYAGRDGDDRANNAKLLSELAGVEESRRTARFVCCAALAGPDGETHTERGSVEGRVLFEPRGASGFGYDPLFVPNGYDQTFAELPLAEKQAVSHRGRAFRRLRAYLESLP